MRTIAFIYFFFTLSVFGQEPLHFVELGSEPALCRTESSQSGNGVVYAAAAGGVPDYSYTWISLSTGLVVNNSTMGGLNTGYYEITVEDNVGAILKDTVYVDSINPEASFTIENENFDSLNNQFEIVVPSMLEIWNTSQEPQFSPWPDSPRCRWYTSDSGWGDSLTIAEGLYFEFEISEASKKEICLVYWNKNQCVDTTCSVICARFSADHFVDHDKVFAYADHDNGICKFYNLTGDDYQVKVYDQQGKLITVVDLCCGVQEQLLYFAHGIYICHFEDQITGEVLRKEKLLF